MGNAIGDIVGISAELIVSDVSVDGVGLVVDDTDRYIVRINISLIGDIDGDDIGAAVDDAVGDTTGLSLKLTDGDTISDDLGLMVGNIVG